jgi:predicted metal-dependent hydrolase
MIPSSFWQGVQQFNQQQFYPCHDTLEAIWIEAPESDRNFYQGILQIAVACYHLGNKNWRGAVILLGEGAKRLRDYQPQHHNIDVGALLEDSLNLLLALQQIEPEQMAQVVEQLNTCQQVKIETDRTKVLIELPQIKLIES